jgi:hypothetical protein
LIATVGKEFLQEGKLPEQRCHDRSRPWATFSRPSHGPQLAADAAGEGPATGRSCCSRATTSPGSSNAATSCRPSTTTPPSALTPCPSTGWTTPHLPVLLEGRSYCPIHPRRSGRKRICLGDFRRPSIAGLPDGTRVISGFPTLSLPLSGSAGCGARAGR